MTTRTIQFDPLRVEVDEVEIPVENISYMDEDGNNRIVYYVSVNGEKIPIQYRVELVPHLTEKKLDQALAKVQEAREKKPEVKTK